MEGMKQSHKKGEMVKKSLPVEDLCAISTKPILPAGMERQQSSHGCKENLSCSFKWKDFKSGMASTTKPLYLFQGEGRKKEAEFCSFCFHSQTKQGRKKSSQRFKSGF